MGVRKYFTRESAHGSATSYGFDNDTIVLVFSSRHARDAYIVSASDLSLRPIPRCDVGREAANWSMSQNRMIRPRPFSGECWVIEPQSYADDEIQGCLGTIGIGYSQDRLKMGLD